MTSRRAAGLALGGYAIATFVALAGSPVPGGAYEPDKVRQYAAGGLVTPILLGALVMAAACALLLLGRHLREEGGVAGGLGRDLAVVGAAAGVVGGMAQSGLSVALLEGGAGVSTGLTLPVVYALGEIVNLLAVCAPAFAVGVLALLLAARYPMPAWLRVLTVVGGVCGVTAPLFVTLFVFLLWAVVLGTWLAVGGERGSEVNPVVGAATPAHSAS